VSSVAFTETLNRSLGAYLGFACGDALGATVEFMSPGQIQQRYGRHTEIIGGGWLGLAADRYCRYRADCSATR
jgi:ADP-ribosylglycohydrolase